VGRKREERKINNHLEMNLIRSREKENNERSPRSFGGKTRIQLKESDVALSKH